MAKKPSKLAQTKSSAQSAIESIKALTQGKSKPVLKKPADQPENQKIKKGKDLIPPTKPKKDGRKNNGGKGDVGRKPGGQALARRTLRAILANHYAEEVEIEITDPKTKTVVKIIKPRVLAVMEKLFDITIKNDDSAAADKWLNRALGKPPQPLIGDEDEDPVQIDLGVNRILEKAYGDDEDED